MGCIKRITQPWSGDIELYTCLVFLELRELPPRTLIPAEPVKCITYMFSYAEDVLEYACSDAMREGYPRIAEDIRRLHKELAELYMRAVRSAGDIAALHRYGKMLFDRLTELGINAYYDNYDALQEEELADEEMDGEIKRAIEEPASE